jgi:hypothetical protein
MKTLYAIALDANRMDKVVFAMCLAVFVGGLVITVYEAVTL